MENENYMVWILVFIFDENGHFGDEFYTVYVRSIFIIFIRDVKMTKILSRLFHSFSRRIFDYSTGFSMHGYSKVFLHYILHVHVWCAIKYYPPDTHNTSYIVRPSIFNILDNFTCMKVAIERCDKHFNCV
jgi:hypothetical protein